MNDLKEDEVSETIMEENEETNDGNKADNMVDSDQAQNVAESILMSKDEAANTISSKINDIPEDDIEKAEDRKDREIEQQKGFKVGEKNSGSNSQHKEECEEPNLISKSIACLIGEARRDVPPISWVFPPDLSAEALGGVLKIDWIHR